MLVSASSLIVDFFFAKQRYGVWFDSMSLGNHEVKTYNLARHRIKTVIVVGYNPRHCKAERRDKE